MAKCCRSTAGIIRRSRHPHPASSVRDRAGRHHRGNRAPEPRVSVAVQWHPGISEDGEFRALFEEFLRRVPGGPHARIRDWGLGIRD